MQLAEGARVGRYKVAEALGAGGVGKVYRAFDTRLQRSVAIKFLHDDISGDPERRSRFEREARAISSLNHVNVLGIHDVGEQDGALYLVTEFLDGETLRERLRRGPLDRAEAIRIARQVAGGLEAIHGRDIVHRDIKPSNLFLCRDGTAKILDFGVARRVDPDDTRTETGAVLGTPRYMAPEQVRGRGVDHRADVFSLGLVIYEMLAGAPAFEGGTDLEVAAAILETEPEPLGDAAVDAVVARCLAKDPAARYGSAREVAEALDTPQAAAAPSAARVWGVAGAALAVAGAIGIAVFAARGGDADRPAVPAAAPTARPLTSVAPPDWVGTVTVSPEGARIAYHVKGPATTWLLDVATGDKRLLEPPGDAEVLGPLGLFPGGHRMLGWAIPQYKLVDLDLESGEARELGPSNGEVIWSLSPDGTVVAVVANETVYVRPVAGGERTLVSSWPPGFVGSIPQWSPDGTRLVIMYSSPVDRGAETFIEVAAADARSRAPLPAGSLGIRSFHESGAAWLDDSRIAYSALTAEGDGELWEIGVDGVSWDGNPPRRRAAFPRKFVTWLVTGGDKLFFKQVSVSSDVAIIEYEGGADPLAPLPRVTDVEGANWVWGWTSDNRALVGSDGSGSFDVFAVSPGAKPQLVVGGPGQEVQPVAVGDAVLFWRRASLGDERCTLVRLDSDGRESPLVERPAGMGECPVVGCARDAQSRCFIAELDGRRHTLAIRRIDVTSGKVGELVVERKFGMFDQLLPTAEHVAPIAISPDGSQIAMASEDAIAVIDVETRARGEHPMRMSIHDVAWTNDPGTWLVTGYLDDEESSFVVASVTADGKPRVLRRYGHVLHNPTLSPDGKHVAVTMRRIESNVWVMEGL